MTDDGGSTLSDVVAGTSPDRREGMTVASEEMRFYRMEVPPGCVAVVPPVLHNSYRMLLNGRELSVKGDSPIDIRASLKEERNVLVIIGRKNDPLVSPIQFVTGETAFSLKSWTLTGLANFSGTAVYTNTFSLPDNYSDKRVMLDLGRVSSVADVFVNGEHAGALVWRPYRLDISNLLKPGKNELRILVTNTEANQRAVGTSRHILPAIDISGMEGPVRLVPYIDQELILHLTQDESKRQAIRAN